MDVDVQYIGVNELDDMERDLVESMTAEYIEKLQKKLKGIAKIVLHLKSYRKEGNQAKFSISIRVSGDHTLESSDHDWELPKAMHLAFKNLLSQIEHMK